MTSYDIVIVGGGPAGLAAAVSAKNNGIDRILSLEPGICQTLYQSGSRSEHRIPSEHDGDGYFSGRRLFR